MCRFSEANRQKLGNAVAFVALRAKYPYKTEVLKLLFLMEERMVQQYHVPFLGIPFSVWRLGPVSVDVFEELSDGPQLLDDYIALEPMGVGVKVSAKKVFEDDEFSDAELKVMDQVMEKYGHMTSEELIEVTHRDGGLWKVTAEECGLLEDFEMKRANSSQVVIDMGRQLCPDARAFYNETLEVRQAANLMRLQVMFAEGQLLKFDPFLFKNGRANRMQSQTCLISAEVQPTMDEVNGAPSKPKFYVVLKHMGSTGSPELGEDLMMASLPTSQDHVPGDLSDRTGCVSFPERGVNAYVMAAGEVVTDAGFAFPLKTFVYGEQVDEYRQSYLDEMGAKVENLGILPEERLEALRKCLKQSPLIKRRYWKLL